MSAYLVEVAPAVERDIREALLWYADRNQLIADAFRTEVFDAIDRLGTSPLGKAADTLGIVAGRCIDFRIRLCTK